MTTLAVLHPTNHLAEALREELERDRGGWTELRLLSTRDDEIGVLAEVRGGAALVQRWEPATVDGVDVLFACGATADDDPVLAALPDGMRAIVLARDTTSRPGRPVVAGVNGAAAAGEPIVLSPHPAVVHLALLLAPLGDLAPDRAAATIIAPVSGLLGTPLDDLLGQVRALLGFQAVETSETFPRQVAFNVFPSEADAGVLPGQLQDLLGMGTAPALQIVQAGVFHSQSVSLFVDLPADPDPAEIEERLTSSQVVRIVPADEEAPGSIDAASTDDVLVSGVRRVAPGRFAIWSVMDNLTRGGALNAVALWRALAG